MGNKSSKVVQRNIPSIPKPANTLPKDIPDPSFAARLNKMALMQETRQIPYQKNDLFVSILNQRDQMEANVLTSKMNPGSTNRIKVDELSELLTLKRHSIEEMEKKANVIGIHPEAIHSLSKHYNTPEVVNGSEKISQVIWIDDLSVYRQEEVNKPTM